jgi:hypothetical protein
MSGVRHLCRSPGPSSLLGRELPIRSWCVDGGQSFVVSFRPLPVQEDILARKHLAPTRLATSGATPMTHRSPRPHSTLQFVTSAIQLGWKRPCEGPHFVPRSISGLSAFFRVAGSLLTLVIFENL